MSPGVAEEAHWGPLQAMALAKQHRMEEGRAQVLAEHGGLLVGINEMETCESPTNSSIRLWA